jgi:hypothetical protein
VCLVENLKKGERMKTQFKVGDRVQRVYEGKGNEHGIIVLDAGVIVPCPDHRIARLMDATRVIDGGCRIHKTKCGEYYMLSDSDVAFNADLKAKPGKYDPIWDTQKTGTFFFGCELTKETK